MYSRIQSTLRSRLFGLFGLMILSSLFAWMAAPADTDALPVAMAYHGAVACRDYLVTLGGSAGHVYSVAVERNALGAALATTPLPAARSYAPSVAIALSAHDSPRRLSVA